MKIIVTGGVGFIGSNLCINLLEKGDTVFCIDNLSTSNEANLELLKKYNNFQFIKEDITKNSFSFKGKIDQIYNVAGNPAPQSYKKNPLKTWDIYVVGAMHLVEIARKNDAPILFTSTIRIHDKIENERNLYIWGNRTAENSIYSMYKKSKIARLQSTFGPNMSPNDLRVIPTFIRKVMNNEEPIVYEDRLDKFCWVDDSITKLIAFMNSNRYGVETIGSPYEISISKLAKLIKDIYKPDLQFNMYFKEIYKRLLKQA